MTLTHLYEDFTRSKVTQLSVDALSSEEVEDQKLASFETGYASGWDDALQAQQDGGVALSDALKQAVAGAKLSQQEVFEEFLSAAKPLLEGMLHQVLPAKSNEILCAHIRGIVEAGLAAVQPGEIEIRCSKADLTTVQSLCSSWLPNEAKLTGLSDLVHGQAEIVVNQTETHVDLQQVLQDVSTAIDAFFHITQEAAQNDGDQ